MVDVIGFGAMNMDRVYRVERILTDGEASLEGYEAFPGGSAANTIYALAKLGVGTGFIGAVGDDGEGRILIDDLKGAGVDAGGIKVKGDSETGSSLCLTDRRGRRAIYISPGANGLLGGEDIDLEYIKRVKMVHLSSFEGEEQLRIQMELLRSLPTSMVVSFAPGAIYARKGLEALASLLERTNILFANRKEMKQLTGDDIREGARRLLGLGCGIVVVTLGEGMVWGRRASSCYITDVERELFIEKIGKDIVTDTVGAGDAFAAGFLWGILQGRDLEECGRMGDITARFSIREAGARAGLPSLPELSRRYEEMFKHPL